MKKTRHVLIDRVKKTLVLLEYNCIQRNTVHLPRYVRVVPATVCGGENVQVYWRLQFSEIYSLRSAVLVG